MWVEAETSLSLWHAKREYLPIFEGNMELVGWT